MIWEPSREFIERTNVWRFMQRLGFSEREAFLRFSREEPERFWDELMREMGVAWFEPYQQVLDASRGPAWAQWFAGGRLNIAHNCLDRWAGSGRIACIWEGENGESRTITFAELRQEAGRVASGLRALGSETFPTAWLESEARAFILYTSGTTGKPKGTVHTHAGCLAQMGKEIWLGFDHQPEDRFFWLSDIGWMMGPWTILGNHLFGGAIFIYDGSPDHPTPARLRQM